ncbi:mannonate dehydratase [Chitinophaga rhizophila]|uniref:Mannonate dehydratase n=1 Tax=Chitinophaga rhizophila TaxID=2866212 RepID=A0ABS7GI70_9BACT|nr:mannonate dehydratase [Chitinophaga rhizophila]MBW8687387.1 mannonate dehydratase [Chitinophaga rhizophila]
MEQTMRWFGPGDAVPLTHIRQAGCTGVVTALHHIPPGEVWPVTDIMARRQLIEAAGMTWTVVESLPVSEDIKRQSGDYRRHIENYKESLHNLATCGLKVITYNFMPVLDWVRTDIDYHMEDGSRALYFDKAAFAAFDLFQLQRPGAVEEYDQAAIAAAHERYTAMTTSEKEALYNNALLGLPGTGGQFTAEEVIAALHTYAGINAQILRRHLYAFLQEVVPVAASVGLQLAIHPDDPPFPVLGLPRIVSTADDIAKLLAAVPSPANGLCFCTGSLGARPDNDLAEMVRRFGPHIHFLHLRNTKRDTVGNFYEADHLAGDADMYTIVKEIVLLMRQRQVAIPMRPDHGHQMLDDLDKMTYPGYSAIGRLKGLAELRGLETGILRNLSLLLLAIFTTVCMSAKAQQYASGYPQLKRQGSTMQLFVKGAPFLVLGGELGNSSSSSASYMEPLWDTLQQMHLNTILAPVYWELVEPDEGRFDFSVVDSIIHQARRRDMHLVLLWFGSWKNSMSCYVPSWVKTDTKRFPRALKSDGTGQEILSAFSENNLLADVKAFRALMQHVRDIDVDYSTVIMVQVENEIGMLPEAREHTSSADKAFKGQVPSALTGYLHKHKADLVPELKEHWARNGYRTKGTWEEVFGKGIETEELFQAWQYAQYTNTVASAGKQVYPLPMFVNAALNHKNVAPGQYPSGGPLPHLMDIWQAGAPAIEFLSPDFYNPRFKYYNDLYVRRDNPLFIPEIRFEPSDGVKALYAIGHYQAIGFSPFSIESTHRPAEETIAASYDLLRQLAPIISSNSGTGNMDGVLLDTLETRQIISSGKYTFSVAHDGTLGWSGIPKDKWPESGAVIICLREDEYIIAGTGIVLTVNSTDNEQPLAGILEAEEGKYVQGKWLAGRRLNGDQTHQGRHIRIPMGDWGIQHVKLYRYK